MWTCVCPAGVDGLPREGGVCLLLGGQKGWQGTGAPPSAPHKGCSCSGWEAGAQLIPHPLISLPVPRSLQELPSGLCPWLDSEGVPPPASPWSGGWRCRSGGSHGPPPSFLSPPYSTASSGRGAQARGFRGWAGTSRVGGVGPSEWQAAAVQAPDCVAGACLSV